MIANKSFENLPKFKYFGWTIIDQNSMHGDIENRLISGNPS